VTTVAANTDDNTKGFTALRLPNYVSLNISVPGGSLGQEAVVYFGGLFDSEEAESVDTREWTLQEQYLSPRTLRFCANQMIWPCKEEQLAEFGKHTPYTVWRGEELRLEIFNVCTWN
jgi:hypothetical protein